MPRNTIGIRREDPSKIGEQRCAIAPVQAARIVEAGGRVLLQPAVHPDSGERKRIFEDSEYVHAGAEPREDLSEAGIVFGLKEVEVSSLLPDKTYLCFSHTHKGQQKNRALLRAMMASGTTLIDYELVADSEQRRLLTAFTRFAGYAGIVDTLWTFGQRLAAESLRNPFEEVPQAIRCADLASVRKILRTVGRRIARDGTSKELPPVVVCVLGRGRTSAAAEELLDLLPVERLTIDELPGRFEDADRSRVYKLVLEVDEMYRISEAHPEQQPAFARMSAADRFRFYLEQPQYFESNMDAVLPYTSILVNCIIWSSRYPRVLTSDLMARLWRDGTPLRVLGDVTCDPHGSIEFSRETWIDDPVFTYVPQTGQDREGLDGNGLAVMAVTNLPCEFSKDASLCFSEEMERFLPSLLSAKLDGKLEASGLDEALLRATILWKGRLTPRFSYMQEYADGNGD